MFTREQVIRAREAARDAENAEKVYYRRGEGGPEDQGAERRYKERREKVGHPQLALFWVLHNCIAHPLIGITPIKLFFQLPRLDRQEDRQRDPHEVPVTTTKREDIRMTIAHTTTIT